MRNQKSSIRRIVGFLNNPEEDGGFWLPNIQRKFVWDEDQICRLFDSILREYPISCLLVWKTTSNIRRRRFIDNWYSDLKLRHEPEDSRKKYMVLDGQQRLQSLFIGLRGSYEGRELYFDCLSGDSSTADDAKFRFEFLTPVKAVFPWVRFKDLIFTPRRHYELIEIFSNGAERDFTQKELRRLNENLEAIDRTFKNDDVITYQELDSIDAPAVYREDDIVEIFIRANSGGTKLEKSDLLFSLLTASWEVADTEMEELLERLNRHGFAFDRDFVLKTCLVLLGQGAQYEVEKFRKPGVRETLQANWQEISDAILSVIDFVREKTFIKCDRALTSSLSLIPLIYVRHQFPEAWSQATGIENFLLRTLLAGAFGGQSDRLLDALVSKFRELGRFDAEAGFQVIRDQQRSLQVSAERFLQMGYGSKSIHLIFNLWYPSFSYLPAFDDNLPQVDHIFPQSVMRKELKQSTGHEPERKYTKAEINCLANCMLLTRDENGAGGKRDILPELWFADKSAEYLELHLIPKNPLLWKVDRFEDFIAERERLILRRFGDLAVSR